MWNLCLKLHNVLSSLMCRCKKYIYNIFKKRKERKTGKKKKQNMLGFFPSRSRAQLSQSIWDPGQTYQHTEHGSAQFSSLPQCKDWLCPWCWNSPWCNTSESSLRSLAICLFASYCLTVWILSLKISHRYPVKITNTVTKVESLVFSCHSTNDFHFFSYLISLPE